MNRSIRRWLLSATLAGALGAGTVTVLGQQQPNTEPPESKPGTEADNSEDKQELNQLKQKYQQDKQKLNSDIQQYGANSSQVKADREQIQRDRRERERLRRDRRRDRRTHGRHEQGGNHPHERH